MSPKNKPTYLYSLPAMAPFIYQGKAFQTIVPIKETVVNSCRRGMKREVLDLSTGRTVKLPYFTEIIVSEKIERTEK